MPACATSPTHERFSADSDRYHVVVGLHLLHGGGAEVARGAGHPGCGWPPTGLGGGRRSYAGVVFVRRRTTRRSRAGQSVPDSMAARSRASSSPAPARAGWR